MNVYTVIKPDWHQWELEIHRIFDCVPLKYPSSYLPEDADLLVISGCHPDNTGIIREAVDRKVNLIFFDNSVFPEKRRTHKRFVFNGYNNNKINIDGTRKFIKETGEYILICPKPEYGTQLPGVLTWEDEMVEKYKDYKIKIRHKDFNNLEKNLEDDIKNSKKVVAFNSSLLLKAVELDIPTECSKFGPTYSVNNLTDFDKGFLYDSLSERELTLDQLKSIDNKEFIKKIMNGVKSHGI